MQSDDEWTQLIDFVGGESTAGGKLKSTSGWNNNGNGIDEFGFSALPGGTGTSGGVFRDAGNYGSWWSATQSVAGFAWYRYTYDDRENVSRLDLDKPRLLSVRCVQDQ